MLRFVVAGIFALLLLSSRSALADPHVKEANGSISAVAAQEGDEHPSSQRVIDGLNEALRAGARKGLYKATGIAVDVRTIPPGESAKTDAIEVRLEHISGYTVRVVFPYQIHNRKVTLGKAFAMKGTTDVFGPH